MVLFQTTFEEKVVKIFIELQKDVEQKDFLIISSYGNVQGIEDHPIILSDVEVNFVEI